VVAGIKLLEESDDESRSGEFDGRRIVPLREIDPERHGAWGWWIVNYEKYRSLTDADTIREKTAARVRAHRMRAKGHYIPMGSQECLPSCPLCHPVTPVTVGNGSVTPRNHKEKEKEKEKDTEQLPCSPELKLEGQRVPDPDDMTPEEAFEKVFWPKYPRRIAKKRALAAWKALKLRHDDQETFDRIMDCLERHVKTEWIGRSEDKIPHPATWLNDRRWEDDRARA
jgi:hypothetical protein